MRLVLPLTAVAIVLLAWVSRGEEGAPKATIARLERPIWLLGLENPSWLLPHRGSESETRVTVFTFSDTSPPKPEEVGDRRGTSIGRDTRSLPLFLAERVFVETNCRVVANLIVMPGVGPVVLRKEWPLKTLVGVSPEDPPEVIISGTVAQRYAGLESHVRIDVWDTREGAREMTIENTKYFDSPSATALALARELVAHLVGAGHCRSVEYPVRWGPPPERIVAKYLDALGQLIPQLLAYGSLVPVESIWGESDMLEWYRALRADMAGSIAARLIYVRGILLSRAYGGTAHEAHTGPLLSELSAAKEATDPIYRLSPLIFSRLGYASRCSVRKAELLQTATNDYRSWLQRVRCEDPPDG